MQGPGRKPTVSDEEILDVFREATDPVLTTREVADQIEIGQRGTFDRLEKLEEQAVIHVKKIGGTGSVWWYPEALEEQYG